MGHKSYKSRREPFTFDIEGQPDPPFTARGGTGSFVLQMGELAQYANLDADSPEGMAALGHLFRTLLGATEYQRFSEYVADNAVDADVLLEILTDMFVSVVGHPLQPPSDSSPGPTNTPHTLKVISPSDGTVTEVELTPEREAELLAAMEADMQGMTSGGS